MNKDSHLSIKKLNNAESNDFSFSLTNTGKNNELDGGSGLLMSLLKTNTPLMNLSHHCRILVRVV